MENEMNIIRFKDKGFILVYPDREEVWNRGIDKGIGVGSSYIRYKTEIYKQAVQMDYDLDRVKSILMEYHPKFGDLGFYFKDTCEVIEDLTIDGEDITLIHPKRMGINVLGRPDINVDDIGDFCDTMKYMGLKPYYWDYDQWGMLYFEFEIRKEDKLVYG